MAEDRHHDREAQEERQGADHQPAGDDQSPQRHRHRVPENRSHRGESRRRDPYVAVEQQWKRHHAKRECQHGEQEADGVADDNEVVAFRRGEDLEGERGQRGGLLITEICDVDRVRDGKPDAEDNHQEKTERHDSAEGRRVDDVEGMLPGCVQAELAPPAQLVETDRGEGADQREAGGKRKEERNDVVSEGGAAEREANDGIDQA